MDPLYLPQTIEVLLFYTDLMIVMFKKKWVQLRYLNWKIIGDTEAKHRCWLKSSSEAENKKMNTQSCELLGKLSNPPPHTIGYLSQFQWTWMIPTVWKLIKSWKLTTDLPPKIIFSPVELYFSFSWSLWFLLFWIIPQFSP